ncbi:MAG: hypothetical protein OHK0021_06000 [Bryobacter sp.]
MADTPDRKAKNTQELARVAMLKPPATDHLPEAQNARHFAELLAAHGHWQSALNYMSHAIPAREGVWWAWYCARKAHAAEEKPEVQFALGLAEKWIAQPTEENRQRVRQFAEREQVKGAPQHVLEAIVATGDMEDPITGSKAAPLPYMASKYIYAAAIASAYPPDPEKPEVAADDYFRQALTVADRIQAWSQYQ